MSARYLVENSRKAQLTIKCHLHEFFKPLSISISSRIVTLGFSFCEHKRHPIISLEAHFSTSHSPKALASLDSATAKIALNATILCPRYTVAVAEGPGLLEVA